MLKYFKEVFDIKNENWINISNPLKCTCFIDYRNKLIQKGYIFRFDSVLYQDPNNQNLILSGIMGHKDAFQDARSSSELSSIQSEIELYIKSKRLIEIFDYCADYSYCEHCDWKSILLINNRLIGASSLVCGNCGGLIASYRLNLSPDILSILWQWERQYDSIDNLSMLCSEYEEWSDNEISNIGSQINKLGINLAKKISDEMGCEVNYFYNTREDDISNCPKCNSLLGKDLDGRNCCLDCHIVTEC